MRALLAVAGSAVAAWAAFAAFHSPRVWPLWDGAWIGATLVAAAKLAELATRRRYSGWAVVVFAAGTTAALYGAFSLLLTA